MQKIKNITKSIIELLPRNVRDEVYLLYLGQKLVKDEKSFLVETGYINSKLNKKLENKNGEPVPWMNYSVVAFLEERLNITMKIMEYGSGASTLFFASKCNSVASIEHDENWFESVNKLLLVNKISNVRLIFSPLREKYNYVKELVEENEKFEIVLIDGENRVETALNSYEVLTSNGVLILDDSSREDYKEVFNFYRKNNFSALNLQGMKPGGFKKDQTTIFYRRAHNCLEI